MKRTETKEPRSHHYIPEFYLNGFIDAIQSRREGKPILWAYERNKPIRKSTPRQEARKRDFYAYLSHGKKQQDVEKALSQIETRAAELIRESHQPNFLFLGAEKEEMAFFVGLMFTRVPAAREFTSRLQTRVINKWRQDSEDEDIVLSQSKTIEAKTGTEVTVGELRRLRLKWAQRFEEHGDLVDLQQMLRSTVVIGIQLLQMNWQLLVSSNVDQLFLTTDAPVVTTQFARDVLKFGVGFGRPGVEVLFPLSSQLGLVMGGNLREGRFAISKSAVRDYNKKLLVCAKRFAYAPEKSDALQRVFDKIGGTIHYGENAFVTREGLEE